MRKLHYVRCWSRRPGGRRVRYWLGKGSIRVVLVRVDSEWTLWYSPGRGYYLSFVHDMASGEVRMVWRPARETFMKKRVVGGASGTKDGPPHLAPLDSTVLSAHLPLLKHCAIVRYDDGEARQPGKLYLETMGSAWKVVLTDPDTCSKLTVVGPTLDDALSLASVLLEAEDTPWEPDPWALSRRKKK